MISPTSPQGTPAGTSPTPSETARRSLRHTSTSSTSSQAQAAATALNVPSNPVVMLYGNRMTGPPQFFQSQEGPVRMYFIYHELSVRTRGRFKLRVALMRLPP